MKRTDDPREKFIETAHSLFATRGFYGTSLADVAAGLGLTKQSVIYHFKTKEALYGAVLARAASRFDDLVQRARSSQDLPEARVQTLWDVLHDHVSTHPEDAQLITRELLDNPTRAQQSRVWYLRDFLNGSVDLLRACPRYKQCSEDELAASVYQTIGAISFFAISGPTLTGIWGQDRVDGITGVFLDMLRRA